MKSKAALKNALMLGLKSWLTQLANSFRSARPFEAQQLDSIVSLLKVVHNFADSRLEHLNDSTRHLAEQLAQFVEKTITSRGRQLIDSRPATSQTNNNSILPHTRP